MSTANTLPATGYIRQKELVGCRATSRRPAQSGILPISPTTLWRKVHAGQFPKPVKLSEAVTAWKIEDVKVWMAEREAETG